ncbi:MAG: FAD-dependent oxidoreductase [Magnetococcales bacterium]|nr:FAD-dependent oxidoreductase [Magnetococcales bacterium]
MIEPSIFKDGRSRVDVEAMLKRFVPEEIVVRNGASWKCPTYVQRQPPCRHECPSSEDIRGYLTVIAQGEMFKRSTEETLDEAWHTITDKNPMPATHGRICPHPCETGCNRQYKDDGPVAINNMERFIGDHGLSRKLKLRKLTGVKTGRKIAVVGSGPTGLSCAYQLARRGHDVTIFEAFGKAGGMLRYGIPTYRLPDDVLDAEIQNILDVGVTLKLNCRIGKDISLAQLRKDFEAVYLGLGAHQGSSLGVEGENSANVFTGASFLNRVNTGAKVEIGNRVVVIGGGDSAVDAARVSLRLQAELEKAQDSGDTKAMAAAEEACDKAHWVEENTHMTAKLAVDSARASKRVSKYSEVTILYRRTKNEMPAIAKDVVEAEHEGIKFEFLATPKQIITDGGRATALVCQRMKLGEPDKSGRRRPEPMEGSDFTLPVDTIIVGIGQVPELVGDLEKVGNKWGWISADSTFKTQEEGVFAGGDVLGLGISTRSVGQGRIAAQAIHAQLTGKHYQPPIKGRPVRHTEMRLNFYKDRPRNEEKQLPVEAAVKGFSEVCQTLHIDEALSEAKRCMSCGLCFVCDQCRVFCPREAISRNLKRPQGKVMHTDYTRCNGCHICQQACPCGYIQMGMGL